MRQIAFEHGAVQRTDLVHLKHRHLFEHVLHLHSVLADYADVVAPRLIVPWLLHVERAKLAERVRREKYLIRFVVREHHFRPVHEGRHDKTERMPAQGKDAALANGERIFYFKSEILLYHGEGLCVAHDLHGRVFFDECQNICRMIGLHVMND